MVAAAAPLSLATAGEAHASTPGCGTLGGGNFNNYFYIYPSNGKTLDWWGHGNDNAVTLQDVSASSADDCFKAVAAFKGGYFELQLWQSPLCLNISGNSYSAGAHAILYDCDPTPSGATNNMLFYTAPNGEQPAEQIHVKSSGLCLDLSSGWNPGSILVQKSCL